MRDVFLKKIILSDIARFFFMGKATHLFWHHFKKCILVNKTVDFWIIKVQTPNWNSFGPSNTSGDHPIPRIINNTFENPTRAINILPWRLLVTQVNNPRLIFFFDTTKWTEHISAQSMRVMENKKRQKHKKRTFPPLIMWLQKRWENVSKQSSTYNFKSLPFHWPKAGLL